MNLAEHLTVVRGGGDLATGVVYQLVNAGFPVVVLELERPLAIRRTVAVASAVDEGEVGIDGLRAIRVESPPEAVSVARRGDVAVLVSSTVPDFAPPPSVLIDARMAKRNIDTSIDQAPLVIALGPGFVAGIDCDVVVETKRGHRLGRVIREARAEPDTGVPGEVGGVTSRRVIKAPVAGAVVWDVTIGDVVMAGDRLGRVGDSDVAATIDGVVRGLIAPGSRARPGLKIADIDPRCDRSACFEISDKSRLVGAGVLEATLSWLRHR